MLERGRWTCREGHETAVAGSRAHANAKRSRRRGGRCREWAGCLPVNSICRQMGPVRSS